MDIISDFLIRIKNAALAGKQALFSPFSKGSLELAKILQKQGFLEKVEVIEEGKKKNLKVSLLKEKNKTCLFEIERISKPGRRVYYKAKDLKQPRGLWKIIVSTPEGLMEAKEALKNNCGGEVICKIMKV